MNGGPTGRHGDMCLEASNELKIEVQGCWLLVLMVMNFLLDDLASVERTLSLLRDSPFRWFCRPR